jgi:outer membrane protein OmpA-like peptidoglycan-associated protein
MMKNLMSYVCASWQRFALIACLLFGVSGLASAQEAGNEESNAAREVEWTDLFLKKHWFAGFGIGPRVYFGDHNRQMKVGDLLSPGGEVYLGKWWSPIIGTRIGYSLQSINGVTQHSAYAVDPSEGYDVSQGLYKQKFNVGHLYGDVMLNMTNLILGNNPRRIYDLSLFAGLGWMRNLDFADELPKARQDNRTVLVHGKAVRIRDPRKDEVSASVGLFNTFHLSNVLDLTLDIRGSLVSDDFDGERGGRENEGILSANLGLVYTFGGRAWALPNESPNAAELAQLNERITEIVGENAQLRDQLTQVEKEEPLTKTVVEKVIEWKDIVSDVYIRFEFGKSDLTKDARVQLSFLADLLKKYPEGSYTITGYADEGTGSADYNDRLSRARAESVKNCLMGEHGIASSRLQTIAAGGIENRYYDDPKLSRSVVVRPNK